MGTTAYHVVPLRVEEDFATLHIIRTFCALLYDYFHGNGVEKHEKK